MSTAYSLDLDVAEFGNRLLGLSSWDWNDFLNDAAAVMESGARRRMGEEKRTAAGDDWPDWSDDYAKTRHGNHALLQNEGDLLDSISGGVQGFEAYAGSNLVYAAHQFLGSKDDSKFNIPARNPLGLSEEDRQDIEDIGADYIARLLQ